LIYVIGSLKQEFVWNEKNIKSQVKSSLAWMAYSKSYKNFYLDNTIVGKKYFEELVLNQEKIEFF